MVMTADDFLQDFEPDDDFFHDARLDPLELGQPEPKEPFSIHLFRIGDRESAVVVTDSCVERFERLAEISPDLVGHIESPAELAIHEAELRGFSIPFVPVDATYESPMQDL